MARQDVERYIEGFVNEYTSTEELEFINLELDGLKHLPSVTSQEPKTGHWIVEKWNNKEHHSCSSCQHVVDYEPCYHYCPYCGAKMIEPQESEVDNG